MEYIKAATSCKEKMLKKQPYDIHVFDEMATQPTNMGWYYKLRGYDAYIQEIPHAADTMRKYFAKAMYRYYTEIYEYDTIRCDGACKELLKAVLVDSAANISKHLNMPLIEKLESLHESDQDGALWESYRTTNTDWLEHYIDSVGFPTVNEIGEENGMMNLLLIHAHNDFRARMYDKMYALACQDLIPWHWLVLLYEVPTRDKIDGYNKIWKLTYTPNGGISMENDTNFVQIYTFCTSYAACPWQVAWQQCDTSYEAIPIERLKYKGEFLNYRTAEIVVFQFAGETEAQAQHYRQAQIDFQRILYNKFGIAKQNMTIREKPVVKNHPYSPEMARIGLKLHYSDN